MSWTERKKDRSRGVLICGAYGMRNAGDEAVLEAILAELRQIDPDMPVTVLSRDPHETAALHGVHAIHSFDLPKVWRAMRRCRLFIHGGGSLVQDATSMRSLWYYLYTLVAAKHRRSRVMLYGCGIGPVHHKRNRRLAGWVIDRYVDAITLREERSAETLRALGVTKPEITVAAEPALRLSRASDAALDALYARLGLDAAARYFCICVRHWPGMTEKLSSFAGAAEYARARYGLTPLILSINQKQDQEIARQLHARIPGDVPIVTEAMCSGEMIGLFSRMEVVLAMRLHALIFAAGSAVPLIGVSYDPKVASFLEFIDSQMYAEFDDLQAAQQLNCLIDAAMQTDRAALEQQMAQLRIRAARSREVAQALLEREAL